MRKHFVLLMVLAVLFITSAAIAANPSESPPASAPDDLNYASVIDPGLRHVCQEDSVVDSPIPVAPASAIGFDGIAVEKRVTPEPVKEHYAEKFEVICDFSDMRKRGAADMPYSIRGFTTLLNRFDDDTSPRRPLRI